MYLYIKALHIIFVVTWFSGLFYIVRLFIYNTEAGSRAPQEAKILRAQFGIMIRRLWLIITWPSAILTAIFGGWTWALLGELPGWLAVKLLFVAGLYAYHLSLHRIYLQQKAGIFRYSSHQLRLWNELATLLLFAIVFLAVVKQALSGVWALSGLALLMLILFVSVRLYRRTRERRSG